ncbi:MAG: hypothetical protein KF774_14105 [Planctomyces sp.]|nr:hypothetical protein [Planctomyces sp.]
MSKLRTCLLVALASAGMTAPASAQWRPLWDPCNACPQPVAVCPPVMQAIPQTVYRDVPTVEYRAVQRTEKRPVIRTVEEERPVTVYRQVMEARTQDVQSVSYQHVTECQQQCVNRSHWRTVMQPVPKMAACQYDSRPGLLGELNRMGYSTRMAFTPDYIPRREFVPDVQMVNVPVNRVVAVPTVRQVTYNVARTVAEQTTQKVAVQKIEYVDQQVTAYEPVTVTKRMAVGTTYTYAFMDGFGGTGTTATAAAPTPADENRSATAPADDVLRGISAPPKKAPAREPEPTPASPSGPVASTVQPQPTVKLTGWRAAKTPLPPVAGEANLSAN